MNTHILRLYKSCSITFLLLFSFCVTALGHREFDVFFNRNDFTINLSQGIATIQSATQPAIYSDDTSKPAFPLYSYKILLPEDAGSLAFNISFEKELIFTNVEVEKNAVSTTTNGVIVDEIQDSLFSILSPIINQRIIRIGSLKYMNFTISPFLYYKSSRSLFFISHLIIAVPSFTDSQGTTTINEWPLEYRDIADEVVNPGDFTNFYPTPFLSNTTGNQSPLEYLIITSPSLQPSFQNLASWKRRKGIHTEIVTTDSIYNHYPGNDYPQKIKSFINSNLQRGLKFVLLGGDDSIIPYRQCRYVREDGIIYLTPSDLYYSCFSDFENQDWDKNGNGYYGDEEDSINFHQDVYLSRLPIRTSTHVSDYTSKLIKYEMATDTSACNRILMAGQIQDGYHATANYYNEYLYNNYILPYWNGEKYYMYEGSGLLPDGTTYPILVNRIKDEFDRGYNIIHETSHGEYDRWNIWNDFYGLEKASNQINDHPTIVVSIACYTNAFQAEPCLSEALLRNPSGGAISYFGSSIAGFSSRGNAFNGSHMYDAFFFKHLFKGTPRRAPYSFGAVAAAAKETMVNYFQDYELNKVLQLSINPMGDPEMPIFTDNPINFDKTGTGAGAPVVMINPTQKKISVTSTVGGCRIVLLEDDGNIQVVDSTQNAIFNTHYGSHKITILKHNYIPYLAEATLDSIPPFVGPVTFSIKHDGSLCTITPQKIITEDGFYYSDGFEPMDIDRWNIKIVNMISGETKVDAYVDTSSYTCNTSAWQPGAYVVIGRTKECVGQKKMFISK